MVEDAGLYWPPTHWGGSVGEL